MEVNQEDKLYIIKNIPWKYILFDWIFPTTIKKLQNWGIG